MIDEHTREDELEILIIGLQGEIDKLKKENMEYIEKFIGDLNDCLKLEDDGSGNKISCDCESNVIKKLEKWQKESEIKFDNNGVLIHQKVKYEVEHDEETKDLINNIKKKRIGE